MNKKLLKQRNSILISVEKADYYRTLFEFSNFFGSWLVPAISNIGKSLKILMRFYAVDSMRCSFSLSYGGLYRISPGDRGATTNNTRPYILLFLNKKLLKNGFAKNHSMACFLLIIINEPSLLPS